MSLFLKKFAIILLLSSFIFNFSFAHNHHQKNNFSVFEGKKIFSNVNENNVIAKKSTKWLSFKNEHKSWFATYNNLTFLPHKAYGKPIAVNYNSNPVEMANQFINNHLQSYNLQNLDLSFNNSVESEKYQFVNYSQFYQGFEVLNSRLQIRITNDGKIASFQMDLFDNIDIITQATMLVSDAANASIEGLNENLISFNQIGDLKVLPVPADLQYNYKLVYELEVNTSGINNLQAHYYTLIDANDGTVYYRQNKVCNILEGNFTADISKNYLIDGVENVQIPSLKIEIGNQVYYADKNGYFNLPGNTAVNATISCEGPNSRVYNVVNGNTIPSFSIQLEPGINNINIEVPNQFMLQEISAYRHVNVIHDTLRSLVPNPAFTALDYPLPTNVERNDGECNAFYDGASINFYQTAAGCYSLALYEDVVFHEYGHGINSDLYNFYGTAFDNGALGEGYADIWAFYTSTRPILALGYLLNNTSNFIRRYDIDPKRYPEDINGEIHNDGEIIAGAFYDTAINLGDFTQMMKLFVESYVATPMLPNGQEGQLYTDILFEVLYADDDNANLLDGTPNDIAIIEAFSLHGISVIGNVEIVNQPVLEAPENTAITIDAEVIIDFPTYLGGINIWWRTDNTQVFEADLMNNTSGTEYTFDLPSLPKGTIIEYFFDVADVDGNTSSSLPFQANNVANPNLPNFILVGFNAIITEDFDNNYGAWEFNHLGTDDATTGMWTVDSPNESTQTELGFVVQPGIDHTENSTTNLCLLTQNAPSSDAYNLHDVDAGATSVVSPALDLSDYTKPAIAYWRWYTNASSANPGNDYWKVFISDNNINWLEVERTNVEDVSWRRNVIDVKQYFPNPQIIRVMFVAEDSVITDLDFNGGSIVEAAIDDFVVYDTELSGLAPAPAFTSLIIDNFEVQFTDNTLNNPTNWNWNFGDSNFSTLQNPTHIYSYPGVYNVCLVATNPNGINSVCSEIVIADPTSISNGFINGFSIYPNPASNNIFVKSNNHPIDEISIYNSLGKLVFISNTIDTNSPFKINTENLSTGIYLIDILSKHKHIKQKVIIER